jgi:hypothetical protein
MAKYRVFGNTANGYKERLRDGFNWPAFLLGPLWYLFNGMVAEGTGWLILGMGSSFASLFFVFIGTVLRSSILVVFSRLGGVAVWFVAGAMANRDLATKYLRGGWRFIGYEQDGSPTR